jgi:hypothetical protein
MKKFMVLYRGPATPMESMTSAENQNQMSAWQTWMEGVQSHLVDVGLPMAGGRAIVDDGSTGIADELNGYSIISAESIDEAVKLVENHPFLSEKKGRFSIEVFDLLPMPEM